MNIAFVASEAVPFAKVGGLADVVGALPLALQQQGHQVTVFIPWYLGIEALYVGEGQFECSGALEGFGIGHAQHQGVKYVLVGLPDFARDKPYGYNDDFQRFVRFQLAVATLLGEFDIVHAHDWQAGLLPLLQYLGWFSAPTVFTIHNLAYQGVWDANTFYNLTRLPGETYYSTLEHHGSVNLLKCGIRSSWAVTTVSPNYCQEILTPRFGEGLEGVLLEHQDKLYGILNGLDTEYWNPATDTYVQHHYSLQDFRGKAKMRTALLEEFGLLDRPTLGVVSRFVHQKAIDVLVQAIPQLMDMGVNLAVLGNGDAGLEDQFTALAAQHQGQIAYAKGYNEGLAHRIYAGSDGFLMPSRFEPCGLTQMIAMRYGTPPIVSAVGGLVDTVQHWETGFVFGNTEASGIVHGVSEFLKHPNRTQVALAGMAQQLSWDASAQAYIDLYQQLRARY